ncbi:MAG TPA: nucleoside-triphosphatase [Acidobacteriota bacterium]|nr:nucleoside-triphosphatase [Acidobacteriota bacterium]
MVLVLSGLVHAGKTTFLERALPLWAARGLACAGFLSPAVTDAAGETGYDLVEIATGRRQPYLRRQGGPGAERTGPYVFVPAALKRARTIIREAGPSRLLVVDEVGPLELRGGGLWPALRDALREPGRTLLAVVRKDILGEFAALLAPLVPVVFDVGDAEARGRLDQCLFPASRSHDGQG